MKRWKQGAVAVALAGCMIFFLSACSGNVITTGTPVPGGIGAGPVLSIEQGFTEKQQQRFWFTTQGTEFIPYDWLLALEQANSNDLFRSTDNINRLGYIPLEPTKWNPDGLPLGWVKGTNRVTKRDWMGFTCAACHTGTFTYEGTRWIVEGGPTMADFGIYITDLIAAMTATHTDDAKFTRFGSHRFTSTVNRWLFFLALTLRKTLLGGNSNPRFFTRKRHEEKPSVHSRRKPVATGAVCSWEMRMGAIRRCRHGDDGGAGCTTTCTSCF